MITREPPQQILKAYSIIAMSGLGGHAYGSFKERRGEHMWLRDSLPEDVTLGQTGKPMARVMLYGYDSGIHDSSSFQHIEDIATGFRAALEDCRLSRPLILIGHSLGGLIIKEVWFLLTCGRKLLIADGRLSYN